jgi:hypothetical protein
VLGSSLDTITQNTFLLGVRGGSGGGMSKSTAQTVISSELGTTDTSAAWAIL